MVKAAVFRGFIVFCGFIAMTLASPANAQLNEDVVLFTINFCPECLGAKRFLKDHDIPFTEYNIEENDQAYSTFKRLNARGTPYFFIKGKRLSGFDERRFTRLYEKVTGKRINVEN